MHKEILLENIDKIHTTEMGIGRIQKNLGIDGEPVSIAFQSLSRKILLLQKKEKTIMLMWMIVR